MTGNDTPAAGKRSLAAGADAGAAGDPVELSFEAALERLEGIVDRLEGGDLALEQAIESFEQGARIARRCSEQLAAGERRISVLMEEGGEWVSRAFGESSESAAEGADPELALRDDGEADQELA